MDYGTRSAMAEKIAKISAARRRYTLQTRKLANDMDVIAFLCDEIEDYRDKIKELKGRLNAMYGVQTATEVTTEQAADGGVMTLVTHSEYERVQDVLLRNGYFVCSHFDDETTEDETITIEYWRA